MGRGKSQARLEDLTLRKNHHTPSQALGCGGGGCPSVSPPPPLQRKERCGGVGGMLASWAWGPTGASPSASCLFHTALPCGPGDGRGPRALPFPSEEAAEQWSGEAKRQLPWEQSPGAS